MSLEDFIFIKNETGLVLSYYSGDEEIVVIPETFKGKYVTEIGGGAFLNIEKINEIVIPETIIKISSFAFRNCINLEKINLPNSLVEIGQNILSECESLMSIELPQNLVEIPYGMFSDCISLEEITIPDSVRIIGKECFENCLELTHITLPEGIVEINEYVFSYCENLKEITLPNSLKTIHHQSFDKCKNLEKIIFEGKKISVEYDGFNGCDKLYDIPVILLKQLTIKQQVTCFINALRKRDQLDEKQFKEFLNHLNRKKELKFNIFTTNIPVEISFLITKKIKFSLDELTLYLEENIKKENTQITAMLLEYKDKNYSKEDILKYNENAELVQIGLELPTLKQLKLNWNVGKGKHGICISGYVGKDTDVTMPEKIADGTPIVKVKCKFSYLKIKNLTIGEGVVTLDNETFQGARDLTTIKLPNSLKSIGHNAFCYCVNLKSINLPEGLETLGRGVFYLCKNLEEISVPSSVEKLGVTWVSSGLFGYCKNLKSVKFPDTSKFKEIPRYCFIGCESLTEFVIPKNITKICLGAFENCKKLEKIVIPETVIEIEEFAFQGCIKLKEVVISSKTKVSKTAFCPAVKIISVDKE